MRHCNRLPEISFRKRCLLESCAWAVTLSQIACFLGIFAFVKTGDSRYCWSLLVYGLAAVASIASGCLDAESEAAKGMVIITGSSRLLAGLLTANIVLRHGGLLSWSWTEVFWPVWLQLSMMVGLSLITLSMAFNRASAVIEKKPEAAADLMALIFVNLNVVGLTVLLVLLERSLNLALESDSNSMLPTVLWISVGYLGTLFAMFLVCRSSLK